MIDVVIGAVLAAILAAAALYVIRAKRRGAKCIGCPSGDCACRCGQENCCSGNGHET